MGPTLHWASSSGGPGSRRWSKVARSGWSQEWYRGPCGLCGAWVGVKSAFLSAVYLTCNMVSPHAHTREQLRARWEHRDWRAV